MTKGETTRSRRPWPERQAQPEARTLTADEQKKLLGAMTREIVASPVLTGLGLLIRLRRGHYYLERRYTEGDSEVTVSWGRITPLADPPTLLLEQERAKGLWSTIAQGSGRKLMEHITRDTQGTFHGLGALDEALRSAGKELVRLPVEREGGLQFIYAETGNVCSAQEVSSTISACRSKSSSNRRNGTRTAASLPSSRRAQTGRVRWCGSEP